MNRKSALRALSGFVAVVFLIGGAVIGSAATGEKPNAALIGSAPSMTSSVTGET